MASGPITSWQIEKQWKQCQTLFFWAPKSLQMVIAAMKLKDTCYWKKAMTNLDSILKSKDITLSTKIHLVKAMVFPVVMYGCESWTIKKAKRWRIDAFELWCWGRLLRVPWTARRSDQSILKEISPGWCWNWNSSTLATWCEELIHWKRLWCWERLKAEGEVDDRGDGWMTSPTRWKRVRASSGIWWRMEKTGMLQSMGSRRVGHDWVTELNWSPQERNSISCPNPRVFILTL